MSAGPLKLTGEIRQFGFLENGSIKTLAGFGVFFGVDKADSKSFKWPEWLPIQITELGIQWRDLNNHPEDFRLIVSAAVEGIKAIPKLQFSGTITGIQIDVGLLQQGQFPITGIESLGVTVEGDMFGGKVSAGLIGGIIQVDSFGNEISALDQITPVADRVFFLGIEGGFTIAGTGGFTIRLALTEKGPLGVQITGDLPEGILLEPISGLKLSGFSGGVEFFKTSPDAFKPEDLLDPNFAPALSNSTKLDAGEWLAAVRRQSLAQYRALKNTPVGGGFFAAFTKPMVISGGGQIVFHIPETVLKINAEIRVSTDGKILITGDLLLLGGLQRAPACLYANLSDIKNCNAKILLMVQDMPAGPHPILPMIPIPIPTSLEIKGSIDMKYFGPDGKVVDFFDTTPKATTPTAQVIDPAEGGQISQGKLQTNHFVDVRFAASPDHFLDPASITDVGDEIELILPNGMTVAINGVPTHAAGQTDDVYRYALPTSLVIQPGEYVVHMLANSWQDSDDQQNPEQSLSFEVVAARAELAGPDDGSRIDRTDLNRAQRLAVRFVSTPGSIADVTTITDAAAEFVLVGAAAVGVTVGQPVRDDQDDQLYYFPFTGTFGVGLVEVQLVAGAFTDSQGNVSSAHSNSFTVTGPEISLRNPAAETAIDAATLNQQGYIEVFIAPSTFNSMIAPAEDSMSRRSSTSSKSSRCSSGTTAAKTGSRRKRASMEPRCRIPMERSAISSRTSSTRRRPRPLHGQHVHGPRRRGESRGGTTVRRGLECTGFRVPNHRQRFVADGFQVGTVRQSVRPRANQRPVEDDRAGHRQTRRRPRFSGGGSDRHHQHGQHRTLLHSAVPLRADADGEGLLAIRFRTARESLGRDDWRTHNARCVGRHFGLFARSCRSGSGTSCRASGRSRTQFVGRAGAASQARCADQSRHRHEGFRELAVQHDAGEAD